MPDVASFRVKIFADGADRASILELADNPWIRGFTTNPTLMRKAGITDYEAFGQIARPRHPGPAILLRSSVRRFQRDGTAGAANRHLGRQRLRQNPHHRYPRPQFGGAGEAPGAAGRQGKCHRAHDAGSGGCVVSSLRDGPPSCISIFAGRIADAGCDPLPILCGALARMRAYPQIELIWASPRELFNIVQADAIGCHIITVTHDLLKKLPLLGRDLTEYSLDTVKMFVNDARAANFTLDDSG